MFLSRSRIRRRISKDQECTNGLYVKLLSFRIRLLKHDFLRERLQITTITISTIYGQANTHQLRRLYIHSTVQIIVGKVIVVICNLTVEKRWTTNVNIRKCMEYENSAALIALLSG